MENDNKIRKAKEKLEALLLEGIKSGPATPMTKKDWANLRRAAHKRAKAKNRRRQERNRIKNLLQKAVASGKPIPVNKTFWRRKQKTLTDEQLRTMRRGTPKRTEFFRQALENTFKRPFPPRMGNQMSKHPKWIVTKLRHTCMAAPSQWEGSIGDRGSIYIRYRHGVLRVDLSKTRRKAWKTGATIFRKEMGDPRDGYMETKEMKRELSTLCRFQGRTEMDEDWYFLMRSRKNEKRQLEKKINHGIAQLDRGEGIPGAAARAEMTRYSAEQRKRLRRKNA